MKYKDNKNCQQCNGSGLINEELCNPCDGSGDSSCWECTGVGCKECKNTGIKKECLISNNNPVIPDYFIKAMNKELENNKTKGIWSEWKPHPYEWLWEIQYHTFKLQKAIKDKDYEQIKEYSADIANISERAYTVFGVNGK